MWLEPLESKHSRVRILQIVLWRYHCCGWSDSPLTVIYVSLHVAELCFLYIPRKVKKAEHHLLMISEPTGCLQQRLRTDQSTSIPLAIHCQSGWVYGSLANENLGWNAYCLEKCTWQMALQKWILQASRIKEDLNFNYPWSYSRIRDTAQQRLIIFTECNRYDPLQPWIKVLQ